MADNIPVSPSSQVDKIPVATDDVGGIQFQKMKVDLGEDGLSSPLKGSYGAMSAIDSVHYHIHNGEGFTHSDVHLGLVNGASITRLIKVGVRKIHVRSLDISCSEAPLLIEYFKETIVSADGTPKGLGNNNQASTKVTTTGFFEDPIITNVGTPIGANLIPAPGKEGGGKADIITGGEWILAANTTYMYKITNNSGVVTNLTETLFFYEPGAV